MLTDPRRVLADVTVADRIASAAPAGAERERMEATVLWLRAEAYARQTETDKALPLLLQARKKVDSYANGSELQANVLLSQGSALIDGGRIAEALPNVQHAHDLFRSLGQRRSQAKALILLAILYESAQDHDNALRYFDRALEAYTADPGLLVAVYAGRGTSFLGKGDYPEAEQNLAQAYTLGMKIGSTVNAAISLGNLAKAQLLQGKLDAADSTIARGLSLTRRPEAALMRDLFLEMAARSAFMRHNLVRAEALITQRFRGVDLANTILPDRGGHEAAYQIYSAVGKDALALQHLAAMKRLDDKATEVARSNSAALASAQFDYANQELRIAKLKADDLQKSVAFERASARTQRLVFIGTALATALVILLLGVGLLTIRRSRDKVRAANDDLEQSNVALEKALAAKTEFLATTSHEIRTPLNGILGMTQVMLGDRALDPATKDRLAVVHGAGVTMRALVDDILDVAKIETGKMTIEAAPVDLAATIDDATRMWREQARGKGLAFAVDLEHCPTWIVGDAARLRQIIFNLLSNAIKFTATGHVSVTCEQREERVVLRVADTGIGIAPEVHEVIFESFRQADAGTTRQFGGTGLGLSICRNLSRAMGGDVTVESRLGEGAVFTLDLPLVEAEAPCASTDALLLLVVERNPINRAMFKALFEPHGAVAFAADPTEAMDMLKARAPQLILVDYASAGEDTANVCDLVAAAGTIPVALLTTALPPEARAQLLHTGLTDVIERPISKKLLVERIISLDGPLVRAAA